MDRQRLSASDRVFALVLDVEPPQRSANLDRLCGEDDELRRQVEALLRSELEALAAGTTTGLVGD